MAYIRPKNQGRSFLLKMGGASTCTSKLVKILKSSKFLAYTLLRSKKAKKIAKISMNAAFPGRSFFHYPIHKVLGAFISLWYGKSKNH